MVHLLTLALALLPQATPKDAPEHLTGTLDPLAAEFVEAQRLPGLALGIVRDGEVVYARGFGERSRGSGEPVTPQSIFHMASVSKPFTATAAMQLVEAGKLDLDAPLVEYLPYFRLAEDASLEITVRQVLTHTSGFPDVSDYEWDAPQYDEGAAERYVRGNVGEHMLFPPGAGSRYSNMAFDTMGDVIAKASGMSFEEYVRARILEPLAMTSTSFIHGETPEAHRTQGHTVFYGEQILPSPSPVYPYNRRHAPSSTLNSNVEDMCRWMLANLARGELGGKRILEDASFDVMWSRDDDTPGVGLSWFLEDFAGRPCVVHTGSDVGFSSHCILLPEQGIGVIAMSNTDGARLSGLVTAALQAALGEPATLPPPHIANEFAYVLETEGLPAAIDRYLALRETAADAWRFGFDELDLVCDLLIWKERFEEALEVASLNLDFHDSVGAAYTRLGQALAGLGDVEGARETFEEALRINASDEEARAGLDALDS